MIKIPREAILKYAKEAAEKSYWVSPAYSKTHSKPIDSGQKILTKKRKKKKRKPAEKWKKYRILKIVIIVPTVKIENIYFILDCFNH